jgi:hypothetical protein
MRLDAQARFGVDGTNECIDAVCVTILFPTSWKTKINL